MPKLELFDQSIRLLEKTLDMRQRNQEVIASNIANAETPGYTPSRLEFEEQLRQALKPLPGAPAATHPVHFPIGSGDLSGVRGKVIREPDTLGFGDRNGVDLEREMIALAENQLLYETATQVISKKLGLLKYVAQNGQ